MFQVFDGNRPADSRIWGKHLRDGSCWNNSIFSTFDEALAYARKWLGPNHGGSEDGKEGINLDVNQPYDYSGYGDVIEIRKIS